MMNLNNWRKTLALQQKIFTVHSEKVKNRFSVNIDNYRRSPNKRKVLSKCIQIIFEECFYCLFLVNK